MIHSTLAIAIGSCKSIAPDARMFQSNTRAVTYTDGSVYSDERTSSLVALITERDSLTIDHAFDLGESLADTARDLIDHVTAEFVLTCDDVTECDARATRTASALLVRLALGDAIRATYRGMACPMFQSYDAI